MTDEERARDSYWNNLNVSGGLSSIELYKEGYLAGLHEGQPKWHKITDWKNQEQFPHSEGFLYVVECKDFGYKLCEYEFTEGYGQFSTYFEEEDIDPEDVVRWIEIKSL